MPVNPEDIEKRLNKTAESLLLMPVVATNRAINQAVQPVKPMLKQIDNLKNQMDRMNDYLRKTTNRILFTTRHKNLLEAMIADFVDTLPMVGDITEAERLADARRLGDEDAIVAHGMDSIFGEMADAIPVAGEFIDSLLDALLPSNTLLYLKRRGLIDWKPPLPPTPPLK